MCQKIFLKIPGKPLPKQTHRTKCWIDWRAHKHTKREYFPQREEADKVSLIVRSQYNGPVIDYGALILFEFYMPIPKRWPKVMKEKAESGLLHHIQKPDVDNLTKYYHDCLTGIVLKDDCITVFGPSVKLYAKNDNPRTEIYIKKFNHEEYQTIKKAIGF